MEHVADRPTWTFLTHHARVLILIGRDPGMRLRDVAAACGITERAVQRIVADLEEAGYLKRSREGRRNRYEVIPGTYFRHPAESDRMIAGLLALVIGSADTEANPDTGLTALEPEARETPDET